MGGASVGGGSMGDYQPCYKCVVTYPPLHPMDQMEEGQFMCGAWCGRAVTSYREGCPASDGHQLIKQRQNTVRKVRGVGGGGTCVV